MGDVAPPSGYTTNTDSMSSQATAIQDAADDAKGDVADLQPATVTDQGFGKQHTKWHADYAASVKQFGDGATAMCTNLTSFATQLGTASSQYATNETAQTTAVANSGK